MRKSIFKLPSSNQILRELGLKPKPKKRRAKWPKGHSKKHSRASKKAWNKKRRLQRYHLKKRGAHAVKVDRRKQAKQTFSISDRKGVKKWKKEPYKYDIKGVDTIKQRVKKAVKPVYAKGKQRVKRRIAQAKKKESAIKRSKLPKTEKSKRIRKVRATAKKDIKKISTQTTQEAREKAKLVQPKQHRPGVKWSSQRKKEARMVARQTGATPMQADKLIQRARSKGWDYETVNWDSLQGKDLTYEGRVRRLEKQVGRTTTASDESREIRAMQDEFEHQYQQYVEREKRRAGYGKTVST